MRKNVRRIVSGILVMFLLTGCEIKDSNRENQEKAEPDKIQIGMCFDTFVLERWLRDRDVFVSTATDLGAEVNVQNANGSVEEQRKQVQYLIDKDMDAIVIVPVDTGDSDLAILLRRAKEKGIKVVCYDRLLENMEVDLYISFDNKKVGELMAEAVVSQVPEGGKIAAIFGPETDTNAKHVIEGVKEVLEKHGQGLVYENRATAWKEEYAFEYMNECLKTVGEVDAVIGGNDALASMALKALAENQKANGVCIVGQDADILACQRIVEGYQYMTVYKPIHTLAKQAAQYTVDLVKGKEFKANRTIDTGAYQIKFECLEPIAVTKENMDKVIIESQFHFREEVYLHTN